MTAIGNQDVQPDGMTFDPASAVVGEKIKEQDEYEGVRTRFRGYLGNARVTMQVDMSFADVVSPAPQLAEYPVLLDLPRPHLRGYPRETVVAEKVHAIVTLGAINSCLKDFYDLWLLARKFSFGGASLSEAIRNTFARRDTQIPNEMAVGLTDEFAREKQTQGEAFVRTGKIDDAPQEFVDVVTQVRGFVWSALHTIGEGGVVREN